MVGEGYKYILRYTVQPGHHVEDHLEELAEFCKQAMIDDVAFFINNEGLNQGHLTREETQVWMDVLARGKVMLDAIGVTTSINVWCTLIHESRGRTFKPGQNFTHMVNAEGRTSTATVCPLCENWRNYIADIYSCYAQIKPDFIWVDDDFRLHNHGSELGWGGCFCDAHMAEYSRRAGRTLTREEFYNGILETGDPHPFRKIWLDTNRQVMVDAAKRIGDAVQIVSQSTKVGLMCSAPAVHCAEGRDWTGVLGGLSAGKPPVLRPHMDAYIEMDTNPPKYLWDLATITRATQSVVPGNTEIYPEIESCEGLRFTKSHRFTGCQLDTSLLAGADGITLNIFDQQGNGVVMRERLQKVLSDRKAFLSSVTGLGLKKENLRGVKVLVSTEAAWKLHTNSGKNMTELYPDEYFWAGYLSCLGIPVMITEEKNHEGNIVAVSGQYFRNMKEAEIKSLFEKNFVIMDGGAANTLFEIGLGHLAGITKAEPNTVAGFCSMEQVCNGREYLGLKDARMGCCEQFVKISQPYCTTLFTDVRNAANEVVGTGMSIYENRVFIYPYTRNNWRANYWQQNMFRQAIIHDVLKDIIGFEKPAFVEDAPYVTLFDYNTLKGKVVAVYNSSHDDYDDISIYAPDWKLDNVVEFSPAHPEGIKAEITRQGENVLFKSSLKCMEMKVLLFS